MILQFITMLAMVAFCIWRFVAESTAPGPVYFNLIYVVCPVLLIVGLGKKGVFTWPLATILLLIQGHWIVGWVPAALVAFTMAGNDWLDKKYPTRCVRCEGEFVEGDEIRWVEGNCVHADNCPSETIENASREISYRDLGSPLSDVE